jgi:regulator of PEP synthase PpsR (kinase-PPPase family)
MSHLFTLFLISDGTGDTGSRFLEAALHQFEDGKDAGLRRFPQTRTREALNAVLEEAAIQRPLVAYTLVDEKLRQYAHEFCTFQGLRHVDMLGPLFNVLGQFFGREPLQTSGVLHAVDHRYFHRIEAIEFTLRHDDGRVSRDLPKADIILLGISRTSKTPTSVYLAQQGYKVVNIPIVMGVPLPELLKQADQKRVVGLTIDPHRLAEIRRTRMQRMGALEGDYADPSTIIREVQYAEDIFRKNRQWPIIDVTDRAIEETADQILNVMFGKERSAIRNV